jgi:signal transduction histidine kinase
MEEGERPMFARALSRGQWVALDIAAAITYALLLPPVSRHSSGVEFLAAAMIALPVAARRRWPLSAFFVSLTCSLVCAWAGVLREPFLAAALALYMVAATGSRGRREPTLVIGVISLVVLLIAGTSGAPRAGATVGVLLTGCAALGVAWTVGRAVRERRIYAARSAEQLAREAVTSERLRIAREMHDVVSHTLSVIGVKAGVAAHVAETRPGGGSGRSARDRDDQQRSAPGDATSPGHPPRRDLRSNADTDLDSHRHFEHEHSYDHAEAAPDHHQRSRPNR